MLTARRAAMTIHHAPPLRLWIPFESLDVVKALLITTFRARFCLLAHIFQASLTVMPLLLWSSNVTVSPRWNSASTDMVAPLPSKIAAALVNQGDVNVIPCPFDLGVAPHMIWHALTQGDPLLSRLRPSLSDIAVALAG